MCLLGRDSHSVLSSPALSKLFCLNCSLSVLIFRAAECLDFLIAKGADYELIDSKGRTALHYAASKCWFNCIFTLVSAGTDANCRDTDGVTPLMVVAAEDSEAHCVDYLLSHEGDPGIRNEKVRKFA